MCLRLYYKLNILSNSHKLSLLLLFHYVEYFRARIFRRTLKKSMTTFFSKPSFYTVHEPQTEPHFGLLDSGTNKTDLPRVLLPRIPKSDIELCLMSRNKNIFEIKIVDTAPSVKFRAWSSQILQRFFLFFFGAPLSLSSVVEYERISKTSASLCPWAGDGQGLPSVLKHCSVAYFISRVCTRLFLIFNACILFFPSLSSTFS